MSQFQVSDRVLAVVPNGGAEFTIVEGFVTAVEQDGRIVAVRPAAPDEWEEGTMHDDSHGFSWWWGSDCVYHVVDADKAVESCSRMNLLSDERDYQGEVDDELGDDF